MYGLRVWVTVCARPAAEMLNIDSVPKNGLKLVFRLWVVVKLKGWS